MTKITMPDPIRLRWNKWTGGYDISEDHRAAGDADFITTGQAEDCANAMLMQILEEVDRSSDSAYCRYIDVMQSKECLGWEYKVENRLFGEEELNSHNKAHEFLGRHRAFSEVASIIRTLLPK